MNTNNKINFRPVYKLDYAMKLIEQGHEVFQTMPNPANNELVMWIFRVDETFERDLMKLRRKE